MTLTGGGTKCTGSRGPVFYLTAANTAFMLSTGSSVEIGQVEPQVGSNFTTASLSGTFYLGDLDVVNQDQSVGLAELTLNGSGGVSAISDETSTTDQEPDQTQSLTLTVNSDGTFSSSDHPGSSRASSFPAPSSRTSITKATLTPL